MIALWILSLTGCQYLEEQRTQPTEVTWDGYVLAQVSTLEEVQVLDEGEVTLLDLDGNELMQAVTEDPGSGYWRFDEVPVATEVAIRLAGPEGGTELLPELTPTVWRTLSPSGRASWLTGGLFLRDLAYTEEFLLTLEGFPGTIVTPLAEGTVAHLWGEPWVPEDWVGAEVSVSGGDGAAGQVLLLVIEEDGTLRQATEEDPVDLFIGLDLEPGLVTLDVNTPDGRTASTSWPARGGDLVSAIFYALPEVLP